MTFVWEQRKLGEIGSASSGVGFPNSEQGGKEGIPFYKVSDMNLEGNEIEMTVSNNYVTKEQIARKKWSPLNDVPAMYFAKVGAAVMLNRKRLCRFPFLFDNNTMAYSLNKEYWDINFAKAEFAKIDLTKLVQVGALPSYNANDVESIKIMIPSLFEQSKIGNYFDELDRLITLHQRKILLDKYFLTIDWEQRKLSEIATMHARIGWQNLRTSEFLENGDYMLITGTDFVDGSINYSTCYFVNKERYEQDKNIQIKNGSILITKDGTLGKVALVQGLSMPATLNAGIFNIEIKNELEIDNKYLFQYLKAPFLLDYVKKRATGGTIKHLNQNILVNFPVLTPQKLEQTKIGQYFSNLDNLITLHQWKCMISRKNIVYAWEQRKLGDCTFLSGKKNKNNLNLEPYAITNEHGFIPQNKAHDEFGYMKDTDRRAYNIVSKNSFVYNPARINIGSIGYYKGTENVIISSLYEVFQTVDSVYDPFLWQWFKTKDFQNWIIRLQEGSVRLYFYYDKLCECIIRMPKLEEQIKIANYFEALDNLITLHQWECIVCTKIKVNTSIQCKFIKIGVKLQKCILLSIILLFKRRKISCIFYVNILLRFIKVIELEIELIFGIIDGTIIVIFYLKIRCLYLNIFCTFIFKFNK